MGEIVFDKSRKNLKKIYDRIRSKSLAKHVGKEEVLFLAMGGYNRTYELMRELGLEKDDIATFSNLNLTQNFLMETHEKKLILIQKINYTTSINKNTSFTLKKLDLNVADGFEESMLIYKNAERTLGQKITNRLTWQKPAIVILDDPSLNLQYEGHRFRYQNEIGFVQTRNPNADPKLIVAEIEQVEAADRMMFALYQQNVSTETEMVEALARLSGSVQIKIETNWYMKPTQYKQVVGSQDLATTLKETTEIGIYQLNKNKKIGKENARWIVIPESAFFFNGFNYMDEEDLFAEELKNEEDAESKHEKEQELLLQDVLSTTMPFNIQTGYVTSQMNNSPSESLKSFLADVDEIEEQKVHGVELLLGATTEEEYKHIKKHNLAYFLDGSYRNDDRKDSNYQGGKRLISIDVDDGEYTREEIEKKLELQDFFGIIYPTAKYYFDNSKRWRIILIADTEMSKEDYKNTVEGVAALLDLEIDNASKKLSQLMGYPLVQSHVSTVIGGFVNVSQFAKEKPLAQKYANVYDIKPKSNKSLMDFNHDQARIVHEIMNGGLREGERNEKYRQAYMFLRDTLSNPELEQWHTEASELINATRSQASADGLPEKEVEAIYR
ncbi:hypothetical protein LHA31_02680 [Carnobacterium viridans]|uniref:Uncharacterized protein n=1 Tax=Carnobacterium viridans TaxID=174587 RepID=A0A1H1BPK1_9LACT|nr:hypothetical protein [Carnobacterium viridans]UDE95701.1 hypothetical protein LHA31_02680 [Carnobacterium viridans]SDQ53884.1 hypothetical protein SAMN04487752_2681 [Carnobacterium viridans]